MEPPCCSLHRTRGNQHKTISLHSSSGTDTAGSKAISVVITWASSISGKPRQSTQWVRKWNSSEWSGMRIWPSERLQLFCSHEGNLMTIKPTYRRGTANIISDNKIQTQMKVYVKIILPLDFWLHGPINSLYFKCHFELGFLLHNLMHLSQCWLWCQATGLQRNIWNPELVI